jgi:hypothetical protein
MFKNAKIIGENVLFEVYSKQPDGAVRGDPRFIMSRGELADFISCPQKWIESPQSESTEALRYGSLIDVRVLMPETFEQLYVIAPETYTNDDGVEKPWNLNAKACRRWVETHSDRIVIKQKDLDESDEAITRLYKDSDIKAFLDCSKKQVMVMADYVDTETSLVIPIRVLTDCAPDPKHARFGKSLGDLKTSQDASRGKWRKSVSNFNYDMQASLNIDLHTAAAPDIERIEFRHLIQESDAPFQTGRRILSTEFIQIGRAKYMAALKLYCQCLKHNFWPDYEIGENVMNGWSLTEPTQWDIEDALQEVVVDFPKPKEESKASDADLIP